MSLYSQRRHLPTLPKPDNTIQYIHVESNHPPNITKQIPKTKEKRFYQFSSNKGIFNESAPFYEVKLHQSVKNPANTKLHNKHKRKRNILV